MTLIHSTSTVQAPIQDMHARLEFLYIQEYLRTAGHSLTTLETLPQAERKRIMTEACNYAAAQLAWRESRARLVSELYGADH